MSSKNQKKRGYLLPDPVKSYDLICVTLKVPDHPFYREAVRGAITELQRWHNWEKSYTPGDNRAAVAAGYWKKIINETLVFKDCDDCGCQEENCLEFTPDWVKIDYNPNNPFASPPGDPPAGYANNPWYPGSQQSLPGFLQTDVMCDIISTYPSSVLGIPIGVIAQLTLSGLPRLRIHLTGQGMARLHLLKMYLGGFAVITVDDDWSTARNVDLRQGNITDLSFIVTLLASLITGFNLGVDISTAIIEVPITTPGDHFIDVLYIPLIEETNPLASGWGGGLRKVELCGFDLQASQLITHIQFIDCDLLVTYADGRTETVDLGELIENCKECNDCDEDCGECIDCDDCEDCP